MAYYHSYCEILWQYRRQPSCYFMRTITLGIDEEICAPDCIFINAAAPINCPDGSWIVNY